MAAPNTFNDHFVEATRKLVHESLARDIPLLSSGINENCPVSERIDGAITHLCYGVLGTDACIEEMARVLRKHPTSHSRLCRAPHGVAMMRVAIAPLLNQACNSAGISSGEVSMPALQTIPSHIREERGDLASTSSMSFVTVILLAMLSVCILCLAIYWVIRQKRSWGANPRKGSLNPSRTRPQPSRS